MSAASGSIRRHILRKKSCNVNRMHRDLTREEPCNALPAYIYTMSQRTHPSLLCHLGGLFPLHVVVPHSPIEAFSSSPHSFSTFLPSPLLLDISPFSLAYLPRLVTHHERLCATCTDPRRPRGIQHDPCPSVRDRRRGHYRAEQGDLPGPSHHRVSLPHCKGILSVLR
jgi:hypothetical protein